LSERTGRPSSPSSGDDNRRDTQEPTPSQEAPEEAQQKAGDKLRAQTSNLMVQQSAEQSVNLQVKKTQSDGAIQTVQSESGFTITGDAKPTPSRVDDGSTSERVPLSAQDIRELRGQSTTQGKDGNGGEAQASKGESPDLRLKSLIDGAGEVKLASEMIDNALKLPQAELDKFLDQIRASAKSLEDEARREIQKDKPPKAPLRN
jgi:hypothetical protein